jgi:hypothetical protein
MTTPGTSAPSPAVRKDPGDASAAETQGSLPTVRSLDELAALVGARRDLFLRWSEGPAADRARTSRDSLTGVPLPGLSASALAVEDWWDGRSTSLWAARRLFDYEHLRRRRSGDQRPWVLAGRECGRGPDNEPLVTDVDPLCWIDPRVVAEAEALIAGLDHEWGPLDREHPDHPPADRTTGDQP